MPINASLRDLPGCVRCGYTVFLNKATGRWNHAELGTRFDRACRNPSPDKQEDKRHADRLAIHDAALRAEKKLAAGNLEVPDGQ